MKRIAIVDDNRNLLTTMEIFLGEAGYEISVFTDPIAALRSFQHQAPDLVVLDLVMPRMDGMEVLRRIRQKSDIPVIILTSMDRLVEEELGLKLGADDFVRKPSSPSVLLERIRAVLRRLDPSPQTGEEDSERVVVCGDLVMDRARHSCTWKDKSVRLTVTEFLILRTLALRPGHVKTREQLMESAYSDNVYIDDRTIDSHIKRIRKKLRAVDSSFAAIRTLYGIGYSYGES